VHDLAAGDKLRPAASLKFSALPGETAVFGGRRGRGSHLGAEGGRGQPCVRAVISCIHNILFFVKPEMTFFYIPALLVMGWDSSGMESGPPDKGILSVSVLNAVFMHPTRYGDFRVGPPHTSQGLTKRQDLPGQWCRRPESNRHDPYGSADFKSRLRRNLTIFDCSLSSFIVSIFLDVTRGYATAWFVGHFYGLDGVRCFLI
jgi:hypothetical protein